MSVKASQTIALGRQIRDRILPYHARIKTFSVLVFANVLASAAGWLTQVHIANTLGKGLFGQVAFAVAIGTFGQVFIRVGLDRTLVRDLIHFPDRFTDLVQASLYLRYMLTLIMLCGLLIWKLLNQESSVSWGIVMIATGFSLLSLDLQPVYDVWQKMERHAIYFLTYRACYLSLVWAALLIFQSFFSVFWIGVSTLISALFYLGVQHRWVLKRLDSGPKKSFTELADSIVWLIKHNWLVWMSAMAGLAIVMLNQLILKYQCGYAELGGYAAAWQIVMMGMMLTEQLSRIGRPSMAKLTRPNIKRAERVHFITQYALMMAVVVIPLVIVMLFFPRDLFRIMFKPEFFAAANILPIFGAYLFMNGISVVASQYVLCAHLEKAYFFSVTIGGLLSLVLCFLFIPSAGSIGAAWALIISHGTTIGIYSMTMIRHVREIR